MLLEQISALFFTDRIEEIDFAYLQDFMIILMSTQVPRSDKISVLQKIIQECIQKARIGIGTPQVKLASQRLFEMASNHESSDAHHYSQSQHSSDK